MADIGKSQARQPENLLNSPAGQTGYATGSRGNAYHKYGSTRDAGNRTSRDASPQSSSVTPAGSGFTQSGGGQHYLDLAAKPDASLNRIAKSTSLFGGKTGTGATQGDAGTLPIPTGGTSVTVYYLMRAIDPNCATQPSYVYWVVTGAPDTTGASYTGSRCGASALTSITVEATWSH